MLQGVDGGFGLFVMSRNDVDPGLNRLCFSLFSSGKSGTALFSHYSPEKGRLSWTHEGTRLQATSRQSRSERNEPLETFPTVQKALPADASDGKVSFGSTIFRSTVLCPSSAPTKSI